MVVACSADKLQQSSFMSTLVRSFILLILLVDVPFGPRLSIAPPPRVPLNTVETGFVVLDMDIDANGKTSRIETAQGMPPFVEPSLDAVRQWVFEPSPKPQLTVPITAVFLFRAQTLLPDRAFAMNVPTETPAGDTPPRPLTITDPGYPVQSEAEGVVILQLQVDANGRVHHTDVVRDLPSLTRTATRVVSQWTFEPAMHAGKPIPGVAIAVVSFLRPVLSH
jgi:outer membrane biosynthesis protein TonB